MRPFHNLTRPLHRTITSTPHLRAMPKGKQKVADGPKKAQPKGGAKAPKLPSASKLKEKEALDEKHEKMIVAALDAPYIGPPKASEEEMARRYEIGRNYVIGCWERHNALHHDLAVKLRMKKYAIRMLPKEGQVGDRLVKLDGEEVSVYGRWRREAEKLLDQPGPPSWRPIPMDTPPIPGFDIEEYILNEDDEERDMKR